MPELIPIESFFNVSTSTFDFQISPDGKKMSWLGDHKGFLSIFFKTIGSDKIDIINNKSWCHISWYKWAQDSRHFVYSLSAGPKRPQHIFLADSQNLNKGHVNLTPEARNMAWLLKVSPSDPSHIFLAQNKHRAGYYDFYKVNLNSGEDELIGHSSGAVVEWITDRKGKLKGRIRADSHNGLLLEICDSQQMVWTKLATWGPKENLENFGITPDGDGVWLLSNKNRDRMSLVLFDFESKTETLVCEDPYADIEGVYISHITGNPLFAYACPDYPKTYILDPKMKENLAVFESNEIKGIEILGMDDEEKIWIVKVFSEKKESFYSYVPAVQQKQFLGENRLLKREGLLVTTVPVSIKSRHKISLKGYLTRPFKTNAQALPMVLYVHGGPWARDYWQPDRMVQFLANRGYVVLQVNFRGSKGFGREYKESAMKEFGKNMHTDLIDAVDWAIDKKIADPEKIAIVGGSYGGFAAMAGLTFTPNVFNCAISINGVSDWGDFISSFPSELPLSRKRGYEIWYDYLGNPENRLEKTDIESRSPFYFAEQVQKPILMIYGEQDRTVSPYQSEKMIRELKRYGKTVTHKKFENEGHGINWDHNSMRMFREIERFLAHHLGGRSEG